MPNKYYHPDTDFIRKLGAAPPVAIPHGTDEDIRDKLTPLKPNSWKLEGNKLTGMTEMGLLVQMIPTDYILTGTDEKGLPVFKKVIL